MRPLKSLKRSMKVNLLGINFASVSLDEAVGKIETMIKRGGFHQVGTINPEYVVKAQTIKQLMKAIAKMALVVPDGVGIVWAAKIKKLGQLERIRGGDLVERLAHLCAKRGYKIGLVGGEKRVSKKALSSLQKKFPGLKGFAISEPSFTRIQKEKPQILLTALGFKGPIWLESLPHTLKGKVRGLVGIEVGGVFNYLAGKSRRPPIIIQKMGLEWLWRLFWEPWRIKRQLNLIKFLFLFFCLKAKKP